MHNFAAHVLRVDNGRVTQWRMADAKPATVQTGLQIQVPLFLTTGEKVKVDTRSGEYLSRVGS